MYRLRACAFAALAFGLAGVFSTVSTPASAGTRWDPSCNCHRPDSFFENKRVVREAPRVIEGSRRVVNTERVVPRTQIIDHHNLVVHVRPVIRRDVIVKRENIVYKNITVHRQNTTRRVKEEFRNVVAYETAPGSVRTINEVRYVKGRDCNCPEGGGGYSREYRGPQYVSSRY